MNQDLAIDIIVNQRKNVFLTGESGAGKTWVINECKKRFENKGLVCAVTATTGIAATHINGITIHSLTGIGVKTESDLFEHNEWHEVANKFYIKRNIMELDVIIIDEISMLHSYQLLAIDFICKYIRGMDIPFGGIQVVACGDFFQLPPVTKGSERAKFVYECPIWEDSGFTTCYLTEQFRQGDQKFLSCLRDIRKGDVGNESKAIIADLLNVSKTIDESEKTLKLYPKNVDVDRINNIELDKLTGESYTYIMRKSGKDADVDRLSKNCLAPQELILKLGAKVMFVKNNYNKGYVNGSIGTVLEFKKVFDEAGNHIYSYPVVQLRDHRIIMAEPEEWCLEEYTVSHYDNVKKKNVLTKRKLASIIQIPLRLAWAITIHKCVSGDTLISTEEGFKYIKDISVQYGVEEKTYKDCSLSIWSDKGFVEANQIFNGGKETCIKITTESGYSLTGSYRHPVLVRDIEGNEIWKKMPDLKIDDCLIMRKNFNIGETFCFDVDESLLKKGYNTKEYKVPSILNFKIAWLLGVLIGDGCISDRRDARMDLTNNSLYMIEKFSEYMKSLFGITVTSFKPKYKNCYISYCHSWYVRNFLYQIGLEFNTARNKITPPCILQSSKNIQKYYIQGLFDTDGGVNSNCIHLTSSSEKLLKEIQILLLNFNIVASLRELHSVRSFRLHITGINAKKFIEEIGFTEPNKIKDSNKRYGVNKYFIPKVQRGVFPDSKKVAKDLYAHLMKFYGKSYGDNKRLHLPIKDVSSFLTKVIKGKSGISCEHISFLLNLFPDVFSDSSYNRYSNMFFEKIKKIEIVEDSVYDLYIPEGHTFIGNGFTNHNSQGMSLDEADMNLNEVFEQGMGYVALSRVRSLEGLILRGINRIALEVNSDVLNRDKAFREESLINEELYLPRMKSGVQELSRESIFKEAMKRQKDSRLSKYAL